MVEFSSLDVRHLARELAVLEDAFVDKAYQTGPREFLLRLRHRERGRYNLVIRPGAWAALADEPPETPDTPSQFAMGLRKALANARVRRVRQHEFDRVLAIDMERGGEPFLLVLEFFGQGNLVVVGGDGRTHLPWRTERFKHRVVKRGEEFKFPPARAGPDALDAAEVAHLAKASKRDLVRFLAVDLGLGGDLAEAAIWAADLDKDLKAADVPTESFAAALDALRDILNRPAAPRVVTDGSVKLVAVPLPQHGDEGEQYDSLSAAVLAAQEAEDAAGPASKEAAPDPELDRLRRQAGHQRDGIERLKEEAAAAEAAAEGVYKGYQEFQSLLERIRQAVEEDGWGGFAAAARGEDWPEVKAVDPASKRVRVGWEGQTLEIDPAESVETNASAAFDQAKGVARKIEGAKRALKETERQIGRRERRQAATGKQEAKQTALSNRTFWFMAYRWFYTTEGFLVIGGRDAAGNERLVKKHMKPGDVYIHADVHGAPSCVLKTEGQEPGEASLEEACRFAAVFSKAFNQFAAGDAFHVNPEQVTKTPRSGEFVHKGSFVIRGKRTYRRDLPMEAGVGVVYLDGDGRPTKDTGGHRFVMGGPWVAVAHHADPAVRVVRGQEKPAAVAKTVAAGLDAPLDAVVAALPSANLSIQEAEP